MKYTGPGADPTDTVIQPVTEEQGQYNREESIGKQLDIHMQKSKKESGKDLIHFLEKGLMDYM